MAVEVTKYSMESAYKDVERDALSRTQAQEAPRAVVLGGQPGSGKSALASEAIKEFKAEGGAVVIDADRMREENPRYKQLSRENPQHAADLTHKEASEWSTRLTLAAAEGRRNLVIDGTMRDPVATRELANRLHENGYTVDARIMAVGPETSLDRARLRFEEQVAVRGTGRFVNPEQHDAAYRAIPSSVAMLERDKAADSVRLYDAGQKVIYENRQEKGEWSKTPQAAAALEAERVRPLTFAERRDQVSLHEDITRLAQQRERGQMIVVGDGQHLQARLETAREDLSRFEQTTTYQRARAFDQLTKEEALKRHPELDVAYAKLAETKLAWTQEPAHVHEQSMAKVRTDISDQLHRGQLPASKTEIQESRQAIDLAAGHRNLMVRDAQELKRDVKGEVVAVSSEHALVRVSDMVAVRFEKGGLDRDLQAGERVAILYAAQKSHVQEQGRETDRSSRPGPAQQLER
jgi:predicted ABC-type ATPase